MFHVVTIEDGALEPYPGPDPAADYRRVVLRPCQAEREIVIAPHSHETYLGVQLLKLALHCRRAGVRVVSVGTMNQLPFFGMFSDEVILQRRPLDSLFTEESSFGFDAGAWAGLPGFVDVYSPDHPGRAEAAAITAEAVALAYEHPTVYLRASTREAFEALDLPEGRILCEIKRHFFPRLVRILDALADPRVSGADKSFQRELAARVGDHWMGVQILASLCKGWRFIAAGGAVNLFNVIPVHPLLYIENRDDFTLEFQDVARRLAMARYGTLPALIGFPHRIYEARALADDRTVNETVVRGVLAAASVRPPPPEVRFDVLTARPARPAAGSRRFLYVRAGWEDREITLAAGGRIVGGPGHYEHGWMEAGGTLVFTSADGVPRVQLQRTGGGGRDGYGDGDGDYAGTFVNAATATPVRLHARRS